MLFKATLLAVLLLGPAPIPDTPIGRRAAAYFDAFNSGDPARMQGWIEGNVSADSIRKRPIADRLAVFAQMLEVNKRFRVDHAVAAPDGALTVFAENAEGEWRQLDFQPEGDAEHHIAGIRVRDAEPPAGAAKAGPAEAPKRTDAEAAAAADALLSGLAARDEFSGVALLARNGKPFFEKAYGLANREFEVPNRPDTKFNIGSMNKFLTTIAIGQLAASGKLSLDDTMRKWIPGYPAPYADRVTIRQLVAMRSGLGDIFGPRMESVPPLQIRKLEDYLPLFQSDPLQFEPGARQEYSNAGFVVLGLVIQKASGETYYDYVRQHILAPAGMSETASYESDEIVPNRAEGYTKEGPPGAGGKRVLRRAIFAHPGRGSSAGGGYSTAGDFLKLDVAFRSGKLLPPAWTVWAVAHDDVPGDPGTGASAALRGGFGFAGGGPGTNAVMVMNFDAGTTLIVFSNGDPPSAEAPAKKIRSFLPTTPAGR